MAEHTRKLHFKDSGNVEHTAQLYTTYGDVLDPQIQINGDGTTGGITLYTTGADTNYPALRLVDGNATVYGALVDPLDGRATNLHCTHNGTEYAVADTLARTGGVGICLVQTGGGAGTWHRIDSNGNRITEAVDFDHIYPWSGIHDETVDGQAMVYVPKFYIKTGTFASGTYSGKKYWMVSPTAKDGYHCHPAFMLNGVEKAGFYIGKYYASNDNNKAGSDSSKEGWARIGFNDAKNACLARNDNSASGSKAGWHLKTVYEWAAIQLLCLIETGTPNVQTAIGNSLISPPADSAAKWRGICHMWHVYWEHTDGYYTDSNNKVFIFNNTNNGSYVDTGLYISQSGWIVDVADTKGAAFDCGDLFLPQSLTSSESDSTFSDYVQQGDNNCNLCTCGSGRNGTQSGLFAWLTRYNASFTDSSISFRIAKYDV